MAMKSQHNEFIIKSKYPGTYFVLLPGELLSMLDAYYFGPLEIDIPYYGGGLKSDHLQIAHYDSNNQIESSINIYMSVANLIEAHMKNNKKGDIRNAPSEISWSEKKIWLSCGCAIVNLHGEFIVKLFWEKIHKIAKVTDTLKRSNLTIDDINRRLFRLIF